MRSTLHNISSVRMTSVHQQCLSLKLKFLLNRPLQLQAYHTPDGDVEQLLMIVEMTDKYHFSTIEKWAVNVLFNVMSGLHGPPQAQYGLDSCSSVWIKQIAEIALLSGHTELFNYVAGQWVDRIIALDLRPIHALEIADRASIRRLLGYAYYFQLLEMGDGFEPGVVEDGKQYSRSAAVAGGNGGNIIPPGSACAGMPASLTCEQRKRLLIGHWSLSWLWDRLQSKPPRFQQSDGCANHQHGCLSTWTDVWQEIGKTEATLKLPAWNVPGRLRAMEQHLFMSAEIYSLLLHAMAPQCKQGAIQAFKVTIKEVKEGLADHFADENLTPNVQNPTSSTPKGTS